MKNPVRNVIVEYKNKRARRGNASLWGNLDLKSIAREVEADTSQSPIDVQAGAQSPEPMHDKAETADLEFLPLIAATAETVADERELSVIDAVEPEKEPIAPIAVQKPEIAEEIVVRKKNRSVRRSVKKVARKKEKTARPPVAETDSPSELLSLESENASLKRELLAKLRAENDALFALLRRADLRTTHSR
ncbi:MULTISPECIES: hypothetical protein [Brucella]|uniref:Uncharacterized protein n=2 Tax=Brucella TaxID=234 RepID=A0A256GFS2_9HYPH|nr:MULTISPECIES: hypothetical protein [Brucella]KAB0565040.1 hypothetical protein F7Q93_23755 [Brucella pituitosa]OYR25985.1 hypothetical protein CES86_4039 [Brucella lupini]RRD22023.1 hypothetical protein ECB98_21870 [Brucellaceae bacterium VT-16-1752]